jgi:hypothetical protein
MKHDWFKVNLYWTFFQSFTIAVNVCLFVCLMVFNATFNNISVILWQSVFLVEEAGRLRENHRPVASQWQTLSSNVVHLALMALFQFSCYIVAYCFRDIVDILHSVTVIHLSFSSKFQLYSCHFGQCVLILYSLAWHRHNKLILISKI